MKKRLVILAGLCTLSVMGQTSSKVNTSTTGLGESLFKKALPDRVTYFSEFSGPGISGGERYDENGDPDKNSISTWNQISFGWDLNDRVRLVANPRFIINHDPAAGDGGFDLDNPVFGAAITYYQGDKLTIGGGLDTILPFARTQGAEDDGLVANPGGFQFLSYRLNEKWTAGSWFFFRVNFYDGTKTADNDESRFFSFLSPLLTYSFTDNFGLTAYYQIEEERARHSEFAFLENEHYGLMANFTVSQYLTLQPMLRVFARENDIGKANFSMWLSGRLF